MSLKQWAAFVRDVPPVKRTNRKDEQKLVNMVVNYLHMHAEVAFVWRAGAGALPVGEGRNRRYVKVNFKGCSDVLGLMRDGRLLALEGKVKGRYPTTWQKWWLALVHETGGVSGVFRSLDDVVDIMEMACGPKTATGEVESKGEFVGDVSRGPAGVHPR